MTDELADAVMDEGRWLFPYRPDALKNQHRYLFGTLFPASFTSERSRLAVAFPVEGVEPRVSLRARFRLPCQEMAPPGEITLRWPEEPSASLDGPIEAVLECSAEQRDGLWWLTVSLHNLSIWEGEHREAALEHALAGCHLVAAVENGRFLSLQDPPRSALSDGWWAVLTGPEGEGKGLLAAPIILYDYPQLAPESGGDTYDATEIDALLLLSVRGLADSEKERVRAHAATRAVLEQAEALDTEGLWARHGTFRDDAAGFRAQASGRTGLQVGDAVLLHPQPGGDIFDLALDGKRARVEGLEVELDGTIQIAVSLDDDPGRDLAERGWPGHRFFFRPEEVEKVGGPGGGALAPPGT